MERDLIGERMRAHYDHVWEKGDAWNLEASQFEQDRYDYLINKLADRRYGKALEIGCGSGGLTRRLATLADKLVATDIAAAAVERAKENLAGVDPKTIDFRVGNIMHFDVGAQGPWDLIVFSETIYSVGWLYPFFDVAYLAMKLLNALAPGGRLLLTNTEDDNNWLLNPGIIRTYRDLFRNVGHTIVFEDYFRGVKSTVDMRVLVTLFEKPRT